MVRTSIIVPVHDDFNVVKKCVEAVISNTNNYELIFIIDQSVKFESYLRQYGRVISTNEDFIFSHRVNLGIARAVGMYICILNDDTIPESHWLDRMIEANRMLGPGLVGASCNIRGCSNPDAKNKMTQYTKNTLNMFATLLPRRILDVVGPLDERFIYYGGEDDDYSLRVLRHGFKLIISNGFVYHEVGMGRRPEFTKKISRTAEVFREKWGVSMPRVIPHEHWFDTERKQKTKPLVSVLMPTRGHADYIKEAIDSVLLQSYSNFELLVGIDGATDQEEVFNILKRICDDRVKCIAKEMPIGSCNMRNELFKESKGEFIALMDSDDIMLPLRLENQLIAMDPDTDIVFSAFYESHDSGKNKRFMQGCPINERMLLRKMHYVAGGTFLMRRHTLGKEKFDEIWAHAFDFEYVLRTFKRFAFKFLKLPTLIYRRHPGPHLCGNQKSRQAHEEIINKYKVEKCCA
jgi:glycosyltransferase involved in cell wall biosynthesis